MEDLQENGMPQNPEDLDKDLTTQEVVEENVSESNTKDTEISDPESVDQTLGTDRVTVITPKSYGVTSAKIRRNFSVRLKVTNDCIIVTVMRVDSDDTLTFVNNIRW